MGRSSIFFYTMVPKDNALDTSIATVIKSDAICDLIFLQEALKFKSDIVVGHEDWEIGAVNVLDVAAVCNKMEYRTDGKIVFDEIMKSFGVRLGFYWGMNMVIKMYRKYYQQFYDQFYENLPKGQKPNPPASMYYSAFTDMVDEYVNIEKRRGNFVLIPNK